MPRKGAISTKPKRTSSKKVSNKPLSPEEKNKKIEEEAYRLHEARGYIHGYDLADWFEAEKLVKD